MSGNPNLTFDNNETTGENRIIRDSGSWLDDNFAIGDVILVEGTGTNDGRFTIIDISEDGTILYVDTPTRSWTRPAVKWASSPRFPAA